MATLIVAAKPTSKILEGKIRSYIGKDNLTELKASDAVKDGASPQLAQAVFGVATRTPENLKSSIKTKFNQKVRNNELRLLEYTRIKSRDETDIIMDGVNYDYYIPDCGPTYSSGNGKTPVIQKAGGRDPPGALYSLGNKMDTGPSSSNSINLRCQTTYDIEAEIFKTLGYDGCSMKVTRDDMTISFNTEYIYTSRFKEYTVGNKSKKTIIEGDSIGLDEKRKYLYFKSLGDTMIVYYWFWACCSIPNPIALLTCDSVVAYQADMFSQGQENAQWLLNYTEKGENHISYVYYKGTEPDYKFLFNKEKVKIIKSYKDEITKFEKILVIDEKKGYAKGYAFVEDVLLSDVTYIDFIQLIHSRLMEERDKIESLHYSNKDSYTTLISLTLLPIIKSDRGEYYLLIRSRFKFNTADKVFLSSSKDKYNLEKIANDFKKPVDQRGGRNGFDDPHEGINEFDVNQEFFLTYTGNDPDDMAIQKLKRKIEFIFETILSSIKQSDVRKLLSRKRAAAPVSSDMFDRIKTDIKTNFDYKTYEDGSLYDMLTYEFHSNPDYSTERITNLCKQIIKSLVQSQKAIRIVKRKAIPKVISKTKAASTTPVIRSPMNFSLFGPQTAGASKKHKRVSHRRTRRRH